VQRDEGLQRRRAVHSVGAAFFVCLGVAAVYATTLDGTFVWDDRELIVQAPAVQHLQPLPEYFRHSFWQESDVTHRPATYYRPLVTLSYAFDFHLHGLNPAGFHLTNILWHAVVCALVFAFARRRASLVAAVAVTAVFGLLPRLTECVAWIAGRTDPMATAFALGAVFAWTSRWRPGRWLALGLLACALLCKEVALAGAIACIVFEVREAWQVPDRARRTAVAVAPLAVVVAAYLAVLHGVLGAAPAYREALFGPWERVRTAMAALGTYAWLVVDPFQPRTQIGLVVSVPAGAIFAGATVTVVGIAALLRLAPRAGAQTLALVAMALFAIAPVLHLVPMPYDVLACDRFLYMPMAAALVAAAPLAERAFERRPAVAAVVGLALVTALGARTYHRCLDWNDEVRFWADAVRTAPPRDTLPRFELGNVFFRAKMFDDATNAYEATAVADEAGTPLELANALASVANSLAAAGHYAEAGAVWGRVFDVLPGVPRNFHDRALLRLHRFDFAGAREDAAEAVALAGDYPEARDLLSRLPALQGDAERLLSPRPGPPPPALSVERAHFFEHVGRMQDAASAWMEAIGSPDATAADVEEGARHLAANGPIEDAERAMDRWRSLDPHSIAFDEAVRGLDEWRAQVARLTAVRALTM
jgi:tetratricopeptide (TPR) repeat protein